MSSGAYLELPTNDGDVVRISEDTLSVRSPRRTPSPSPRRRKKTPGHRGEAGFGSSVINLANTILGNYFSLCVVQWLIHLCRGGNIRYS
jgi:hypothetical protein